MSIVRILRLVTIAVVLACGIPSCEESLPPRNDPAVLFESELYEVRYLLVPSQVRPLNLISVKYRVKNIYDETIQGTTGFRGMIEFVLIRNPDLRKVDSLGIAQLRLAPSYSAGVLTMDPGEYVYFEYQWDLFSTADSVLRKEIFQSHVDSSCVDTLINATGDTTLFYPRALAPREHFLVRGNIQLFDRTAPIEFGPVNFSFCYVSMPVDTLGCPLPPCLP